MYSLFLKKEYDGAVGRIQVFFYGGLPMINKSQYCNIFALFLLFISMFASSICYAGNPGLNEWSYSIADFNGDGSPDVFVTSGTGRGNKVWFNNGLGEFYPSDQILDYSVVGAIAISDIDNDSDMDILIANIDSPNQVWLNDGLGHFIPSGQTFDTRRSICASLGDIDSDGDSDAIVAYADGTLEIFSNNGAGFFNPIQTLKGEKGITSIELKDINNDKISDIVCFRNSAPVSAFINSGNFQFSKFEGKVEVTASLSETPVDLTGDGKPDGILVNNEGEPFPANYYGDHPLLGISGGPDSYGYVWTDATYSWTDTSANTFTPTSEDEMSGAIALGFTFNFYGTDYTSVYIGSDGYIQFSDPFASSNNFWPTYAGDANRPNDAAYGFGTDLDPTAGGTIYYGTQGSAPNRTFIVSWDTIPSLNDDNTSRFQLILYEGTNQILYNYNYAVADFSYSSVGIENFDGTNNLLRCYKYCAPEDNSAVLFYLAPEIGLDRSGTDMPTGSSYNFGRVAVGSNASVTFTITNTGRAVLNISGVSISGTNASQYSITAAPSSSVAPLTGTTSVTVRFQPTAEGVMEGRLLIRNDDPNEDYYSINLYGGGDDNAPTITITYPADGALITGTDNINANATDDIGINRVDFYRDSTFIGTDNTAPYSITHDFSTDPAGTNVIKAIAYDTLGQTAMDAIKVSNTTGGGGPTINITNPSHGANVSGVVTIEAAASASAGINRVEFSVNGVLLCTDTVAPYQCSWDTRLLSFGNYTISAVVVDMAAATASDSITVRTTDSSPEVKITEPSASSDIFGTTLIKAEAWDNKQVTKVDFYVNGSLLCSDIEAPYECVWDGLSAQAGICMIKAVATDNLGQTGSDTITVQRRVLVNLSVMRKTEKAWIIRKDYAEVLVALPDYGAADVQKLQILRSNGNGNFDVVKDVSASELQNNSIQFLDKYLDSKKSYTYKVIVFDSNWQLIGESDLITI